MPTWRNELPPEGKNVGYTLRRTPTNGSLIAIITSADLLVCDTHYWHGRTMPCERTCNAEGKTIEDSHCAACQEKTPWRTHVYVSAFDGKKREHFIYECTAAAAKVLAEYRDAATTLRGCVINACRAKATPNGKVSIMTHAADLSKTFLPDPPDVPLALSVIWRLPRTALDFQTETLDVVPTANAARPRATHVRTRAAVLAAMRNQPDNACDPPSIGEIVAGNGELRKRTLPA